MPGAAGSPTRCTTSRAPSAHAGTRSVNVHGVSASSRTWTRTTPSRGIAGLDVDRDGRAIGQRGADRGRGVLVELQTVIVGGGDVRGQAGQGPGDVRRAARHLEPRRPQRRRRARRHHAVGGRGAGAALVQGVRVEECRALDRQRGRHDVEQVALDEVGVAGGALREQQPPAEHDRRDRRARLGVGPVGREDPVVAERLVLVVRAHAAGEVGAAGDRVLPLRDQRREQFLVPLLHCDVKGPCGQVPGPHGMPAEHRRLAHGHVVLVVGAAELDVAQCAVAAALHEQRGLREVALVAGDAAELDEGRLDLGVPAHRLDTAGPEHLADEVGGPLGDLDEPVVGARPGARPRDRGLQQVADAVELVAPLQVRPALPLTGPAELRVEVAVRLLRGRDPRDDGPEPSLEPRIVGAADLPGHGLEVLVDLGVGELPPSASGRKLARRREVEVRDPALAFEPVLDVRERRGRVDLLALRPEAARDRDLVQSERPEPTAGGHDGARDQRHVVIP